MMLVEGRKHTIASRSREQSGQSMSGTTNWLRRRDLVEIDAADYDVRVSEAMRCLVLRSRRNEVMSAREVAEKQL